MADGIPGFNPSGELGALTATPGVAPTNVQGAGATNAGTGSAYFAAGANALGNALMGQLKKSEENAYLDGYVDQQKGKPVQDTVPWFAPYSYQQGVSSSALHGSISDFQQRAAGKFQEALAAGKDPAQFLDDLRPEYADILEQTKGNLTLQDRQRAVMGLRDTIGAVGERYRDMFAKKVHQDQLVGANASVNQSVRNAIMNQTDPVQYRANYTKMLDDVMAVPGLDDKERLALITGGTKSLLDGTEGNFGTRPAVGQLLVREVMNHPGIQKMSPNETANLLTDLHGFINEGTQRDLALLHARIYRDKTAVEAGQDLDPKSYDAPLHTLDQAMAAGVVKPADYQSAVGAIEGLKQSALQKQTERARLAGNNDGFFTMKDAKTYFADSVNALVAGQYKGDKSRFPEAANLVAVHMLSAAGANVQPEVAAYAQKHIADRVGLLATTSPDAYPRGKNGAPAYPVADVQLVGAIRDEYERDKQGQPSNLVGMLAGLDPKQIAAMSHAFETTRGSDAQTTIKVFQDTLARERKGEVTLVSAPDSATLKDVAFKPDEIQAQFHGLFKSDHTPNWMRNTWSGLTHAPTRFMEWATGQASRQTMAEQNYQMAMADHINGLQRAALMRIQTRSGGLPVGASTDQLRRMAATEIGGNAVKGDYETWPVDAAVAAASPTFQKWTPEYRGEFVDSFVKQQLAAKGINPDDVLGVRLRANGTTIQPEIYTRKSEQPVRVAAFNDGTLRQFQRNHISQSEASRGGYTVRDVATGQPVNLKLSGYNTSGVDQGEYIGMQKSLLQYEGFSSKAYKDPVRGVNIGAGMSSTTGQTGLFGTYSRLPANLQTPQTLASMMANHPEGMQQYLTGQVRPATEQVLHIPWTNHSAQAQAIRTAMLNIAWQRPSDAVPMAQALDQLRRQPGVTQAQLAGVLSRFPSFQQAHQARQQMYLSAFSSLLH